MRTTIEIPDETYKNVKRLAIEENTTVKQIVLDALQLALLKRSAQPAGRRLPLPIIHSKNPGSLKLGEEGVYEYIPFP
jgi:hypothetical protein